MAVLGGSFREVARLSLAQPLKIIPVPTKKNRRQPKKSWCKQKTSERWLNVEEGRPSHNVNLELGVSLAVGCTDSGYTEARYYGYDREPELGSLASGQCFSFRTFLVRVHLCTARKLAINYRLASHQETWSVASVVWSVGRLAGWLEVVGWLDGWMLLVRTQEHRHHRHLICAASAKLGAAHCKLQMVVEQVFVWESRRHTDTDPLTNVVWSSPAYSIHTSYCCIYHVLV